MTITTTKPHHSKPVAKSVQAPVKTKPSGFNSLGLLSLLAVGAGGLATLLSSEEEETEPNTPTPEPEVIKQVTDTAFTPTYQMMGDNGQNILLEFQYTPDQKYRVMFTESGFITELGVVSEGKNSYRMIDKFLVENRNPVAYLRLAADYIKKRFPPLTDQQLVHLLNAIIKKSKLPLGELHVFQPASNEVDSYVQPITPTGDELAVRIHTGVEDKEYPLTYINFRLGDIYLTEKQPLLNGHILPTFENITSALEKYKFGVVLSDVKKLVDTVAPRFAELQKPAGPLDVKDLPFPKNNGDHIEFSFGEYLFKVYEDKIEMYQGGHMYDMIMIKNWTHRNYLNYFISSMKSKGTDLTPEATARMCNYVITRTKLGMNMLAASDSLNAGTIVEKKKLDLVWGKGELHLYTYDYTDTKDLKVMYRIGDHLLEQILPVVSEVTFTDQHVAQILTALTANSLGLSIDKEKLEEFLGVPKTQQIKITMKEPKKTSNTEMRLSFFVTADDGSVSTTIMHWKFHADGSVELENERSAPTKEGVTVRYIKHIEKHFGKTGYMYKNRAQISKQIAEMVEPIRQRAMQLGA